MNYPFRTALLDYLKGGDADAFRSAMETLRENYPPAAYYSAMNFLGTHDTPRILTVLGADHVPETREARAAYRLSPAERERGIARVKLAALLMFTFPGSPTVYYGDEAGMEGWEDPFNRGTYPWGHEDTELKSWFSLLGQLRRSRESLQAGTICYLYAHGPLLAFERRAQTERLVAVINASAEPVEASLPWESQNATDLLSGQLFAAKDGQLSLRLLPRQGLLLN